MAEMRTAAAAYDLGSHHEVAVIPFFFDAGGRNWCVEARPARTGVIFGLRFEERLTARGAAVLSGFVEVVVLAGEGALGAFFAHYAVLFGRERFFPFSIGFFDFFSHLILWRS